MAEKYCLTTQRFQTKIKNKYCTLLNRRVVLHSCPVGSCRSKDAMRTVNSAMCSWQKSHENQKNKRKKTMYPWQPQIRAWADIKKIFRTLSIQYYPQRKSDRPFKLRSIADVNWSGIYLLQFCLWEQISQQLQYIASVRLFKSQVNKCQWFGQQLAHWRTSSQLGSSVITRKQTSCWIC